MPTETTDDGSPSTTARGGLAALMRHLIDYAGLFPPAQLDMPEMVRNYARFIGCDDAWMLGRVIVPVARLEQFREHAEGLLPDAGGDEPWRISGLTVEAGDAALPEQLERIAAFNDELAGRAVIDVIELRAAGIGAIESALDRIPDDLFPFFELPLAVDTRGPIAALVGSDAGAKARTGGVTADLYPAGPDLARFIHNCAAVEVPFKATAGLHHPLTHVHGGIDVVELGFFNVFVAAALAVCRDAPVEAIIEILDDRRSDSFRFAEDSVAWRDRSISCDEVEDARLAFAVSFGSCSFDEPRDDLRGLGLLPNS